ncbi:hypothetical protein T492DRAFT_102027, partial [Pavlovales sp. CCMP2436]
AGAISIRLRWAAGRAAVGARSVCCCAPRASQSSVSGLRMALPVPDAELQKALVIVRKRASACPQVKSELGQLEAVVKVLGSGQQGSVTAIRFTAKFKRGGPDAGRGFGFASVAARVEGGKVVGCFSTMDGYGSRSMSSKLLLRAVLLTLVFIA